MNQSPVHSAEVSELVQQGGEVLTWMGVLLVVYLFIAIISRAKGN